MDLDALGFKKNPFQVLMTSLPDLSLALRAKHWFRIVSRRSTDGGKTWSSWMRFSWGDIDNFATRAAAMADIKKAKAERAREQKRGYRDMNIGPMTARLQVERDVRQYVIFEEVTLNISDELVD